MAKLVANDALGGGGSIKRDLQSLAVGGLSMAIDGYLSRKYALGSFNDTGTVNARGELKPSQAPQADQSAANKFVGFVTNPVVVAIGIAAALATIVALVIRR